MADSISQQALEEFFEQLLKENAPASGPLREVVHNILDEPVPGT